MTIAIQPRVSIVTPVHNDEEYLTECIESVLTQTYSNWEYIIVNNCSTDRSGEIAHSYASKDGRIRVLDNQTLLRAVPNHNFALRQISSDTKYCKIVFSDDFIFPRCIEDMVSAGEAHPSAGIIAAYGLQGTETLVKWAGLAYPSHLVSGREICRRYFIEGLYVFGTSTSVMYRADLLRRRNPFFNESNLHSDIEVCLDMLRESDLAFVHQILSFTRERNGSLTSLARDMNTIIAAKVYELVTYGHHYLDKEELESCRRRILAEYYNYLAVNLLSGRREEKFWALHRRKLTESGVGFSWPHLAKASVERMGRAIFNPGETISKIKKRKRNKG
jgi:glycosyltransferase involved in cell wall biosynthesis